MVDIPTTEPKEIAAGTTLQFTKSLSDFPAPTWTLAYVLINSAQKKEFSASADGTDHAVSVAADTTKDWPAGQYTLIGTVTSGAVKHRVFQGSVTVLADVTAAGTTVLDTRSHAQKALAAIEAVLEGTATYEQEQMQIRGRSLKRRSLSELMDLRKQYRAEYNAEKQGEAIRNGKPARNKIKAKL